MDKQRMLDEDYRTGSVISGLSSLDDDTDEFGRMVIQHARDEHRINQALYGHGHAFAKARPVALTLDNLERINAGHRPYIPEDGEITARPGSVGSGSNNSEPPLNVPRGWGRKGKQGNGWMQRLQDTSGQLEVDTDRIDWIDVAGQDNRSSNGAHAGQQHHTATMAMAQQHNTSIQNIQQWELDQDLTAGSLLASTPAVSKNKILDDIRRREIESLEKQAVASSRLDQIRARATPESHPWRSSYRRVNGAVELKHLDRMSGTTTAALPETKRSPGQRSNVSDKENVPLGGRDARLADELHKTRVASGEGSSLIKAPTPRRAASRTTESLSLFNKLTREVDSSPNGAMEKRLASPEYMHIRSRPEHNGIETTFSEPLPPATNGENSHAWAHRRLPDGTVRQTSAQAPEAVVFAEHNLQVELDGTPELRIKVGETPSGIRAQIQTKTPVVTGAWIDTPGPPLPTRPLLTSNNSHVVSNHGEALPHLVSDNEQEPQELSSQHSRPSSPRRQTQNNSQHHPSALADLVREARLHPQEALGDSTINSLEDILDPTIDATQTLDLLAELQGHHEQLHEAGRPLTQGDKDRRQELLAVGAMNKRLKAARTSIKDASRGLRRVERTIDAANEAAESSHKLGKEKLLVTARPGHHGVFRNMATEVSSLFYSGHKSKLLGTRLTWLGLVCVAFWAWCAVESTLCSFYCHPMYAYEMSGYGVDPDAPRFPFVIPTLMFRPFRWLWYPLAWSLGSVLSYLFTFITTSAGSASASDTAGVGGYGAGGYKPSFEHYYGGARWAPNWVSGLGSSGKAWGSGKVKWCSTIQEADKASSWSSEYGHTEKGNSWAKEHGAWEAGPEDLGDDSMSDDDYV